MHKRTEITIDTERVLVVRRSCTRAILWCNRCGSNLPMLTINIAARVACTTPPVIFKLAETGLLHSAVTPEGQLFICSNSLAFERPEDCSLESLTSTQHFDIQ